MVRLRLPASDGHAGPQPRILDRKEHHSVEPPPAAVAAASGRRERMIARWVILGLGATPLAGCVSPYYATYPAPLDVQPPLYAPQPAVQAPLPAPVPYYARPETRPDLAPLPEPTPVPEFSTETEPSAAPPSAAAPEIEVPRTPPAAQAGPSSESPLQGFRPMRGQTRPGL